MTLAAQQSGAPIPCGLFPHHDNPLAGCHALFSDGETETPGAPERRGGRAEDGGAALPPLGWGEELLGVE